MEHELNPNLLRSWIARYQKSQAQVEREKVAQAPMVADGVPIDLSGTPSAFVPVVSTADPPVALPPTSSASVPSMTLSLRVRLSNGVEFDVGEASIDELITVIHTLGRMPCSGSTKI
jgi:hypothetical protein